MGNDGGSIPTRRELVKESSRPLSTSEAREKQHELLAWAWDHCPLSRKPLATPVVSDSAGKLYNKDAIIQYLLPGDDTIFGVNKEDYEKVLAGRVKSLRDVVEVKFERDQTTKRSPGDDGVERTEKWICPVTGKELGANVKAVYIVPCGHAFAEAAVKEMETTTCLQCNEPYSPENIIPILPTTETEKDGLKRRIEHLSEQGLAHSLKKAPGSKKRKKHATKTNNSTSIVSSTLAAHNGSLSNNKHNNHASSLAGIKDAATASITKRVMKEQEERNKRRRLGENENVKSLFMTDKERRAEQKSKSSDFMSRGFSLPTTR